MFENYTDILTIRRKVFAEVARLAYSDEELAKGLGEAIIKIIPGEVANYRDSVFKERAIVGERLRLTLGLPARTAAELGHLAAGIDEVDIDQRVLNKPLVNVISFACEACPTKTLEVTSNCRKCLAHPCMNVCPVGAVSMKRSSAYIDQEKCIKCGRCKDACPYNAIIKYDRPCAMACGVNAISSDHLGRAKIEEDKCVSCGQCLANCPFGAIADKSQIYQLVKSLRSGKKHLAIVAPAFISQFGPMVSPSQIFAGIRKLGFDDVMEVGMGADIETMKEAKEFLSDVPDKLNYMATSCCPSWADMVKRVFPDEMIHISDSSSPMVATAKYISKNNKDAKIVFIGPCISKKLEALNENVAPYVDFVITFEELMGMFVARDIELPELDVEEEINDASSLGRGFASSGGVAEAVLSVIKTLDPEREVLHEKADGLHECVKIMRMAKAGRKDGYLLEGMACPGGCIGGPGVLASVSRAKKALEAFKNKSKYEKPMDNPIIKD
ncbi:4Fe-4S dicluster domain-containing protein [Peptoniphilus catoniae]|uniref:4Fe-4S dicluster domain-containing protein n=1 Tax=Peptoniphilus catoniae TaxID=1660341 RepID=UPI0010FE6DD1|nr:4Fe-4S dicluster domain-containing protein [Peptoniphilus catoniae]